MELATQEEMDALKKSIHDIKELVSKQDKNLTDTIALLVKDALANHPGFTPPTKMVFPVSSNLQFTKEQRIQKIVGNMPKELQSQVDDIYLLSQIMKCDPRTLKSWNGFQEDLGDFKKALDTAAAAGGGDWVPTDFSTQFYEFVRLETMVAALFPVIQMPSNPFSIPVGIGRVTTFKQAEQTADTGQTIIPVGDTTNISSKTTLTAVGHASRVLASKEVQEDSIVAVLPFLRQEMITAMAEGREDCIMNGDTAGSHEDTDITDAADRRKMWLGLRAHANDNSYKTDLSTFNYTNLLSMRKNLGKYGVYPVKLAWITGIAGMIKLLNLPEVVTVDKYGASATILSGEIGKIGGIPVVISGWVREVLESTGIYSASGTKTALHLTYRPGWVVGERRPVTSQLLTEIYAIYGQDALITTERVVFAPLYPIASNRLAEMGYNFA